MSSHAAKACGLDASAFFKSAGTSCTTPLETFFCDIDKLSFGKLHLREYLSLGEGCGAFDRPCKSTPVRLAKKAIPQHLQCWFNQANNPVRNSPPHGWPHTCPTL